MMVVTRAWRGGGLTRVGVPGQAGCVVLREMLSPGQLRWLLEMGSDGGKRFLFVLFFSLSSILSASGGSSWTLDETDLPPQSFAPFPVGPGSEARLGAETWGPMGCRDRLQQSTSPAQPGPGASAGRGKLVDTRWRFLVSLPLPEPVAAELLAGTCGRGGSCGMLVAKQPAEVELSGYHIPSAAACLLQHRPHPPQAAQEVLPPRWLPCAVPGDTGAPQGVSGHGLNPALGFLCPRWLTPSPRGRKLS